MIAFELVKFA
ncbi:Protein of unknown function [Weissella confusa LBAE C39-2]|nr:Protein of unknown function [Weissella confusa LBAE C39-2]